jgi:hypothetical protein
VFINTFFLPDSAGRRRLRKEVAMTPSKSLPARPSLESLRKQAKRLARKLAVSHRDAQLALAREYGFAGWRELLEEVLKLAPIATIDSRRRKGGKDFRAVVTKRLPARVCCGSQSFAAAPVPRHSSHRCVLGSVELSATSFHGGGTLCPGHLE